MRWKDGKRSKKVQGQTDCPREGDLAQAIGISVYSAVDDRVAYLFVLSARIWVGAVIF